jgi:group II intron reverse transcriptase/maturase
MEKEMTQHEGGLWEEIFSRPNLFRALERVQRNGGAPGVDGMTVEEMPEHLKAHWLSIREKLETGTYQPSPAKRVEIPKPNGGVRLLGIPTVQDRLIQQAMQQVLSRVYEPTFSDHSYGFRRRRSAHDAVEAAQGHINAGYKWVVDIDMAKFFDTVNHDRLMARMKQEVSDKRVLRLVNTYLKAGVMVNGVVMETVEGTPQGGPLSPLLSNIVLDELDRELEKRGHHFVRYADDCNIYARSRRSAERVLVSTQRYIEKRLRLKVQSLERMKRKMKQITRRNQGRSLEEIRDRLNPAIVGWVNYYALADGRGHMARFDEWLRRRMRQIAWKQWKTPRNRYENLRARGVSEYWAIRAGGTSLGIWRLSKSPPVHHALNNTYWQEFGLRSFLEQYQIRHT